jgi:ABC-type nitrate/sulfonate/bicarbonate transport system substrate-binding protein
MIGQIMSGLLVFFLGGLVTMPMGFAQTVKVGITSKTLFFMPYYVGQKKGFYAAENIRIEPVLIGRSDVQLAALLAGELQIGSLNADATIVINEREETSRLLPALIIPPHTYWSAARPTKRSMISKARESAYRRCAVERPPSCWIISRARGSSIPEIFPWWSFRAEPRRA